MGDKRKIKMMILPNGSGGFNMIPTSNSSNSEPDTCPKCGKEEQIVEICKHCNCEYPPIEGKWYDVPLFIGIILLIIWAVITLIVWLTNLSVGTDSQTLLGVLKSQFEFIIKAFKHIV